VVNIRNSSTNITKIALRVLALILPFCETILKVYENRQHIISVLNEAMNLAHDDDTQRLVFEALQVTAFTAYDYLDD
jgi:hypothetical protein